VRFQFACPLLYVVGLIYFLVAGNASIDDENEDGAAVSNSPLISIATLSQRPPTTPQTRPSLPTRMNPRKSHSAAKTATTKLLPVISARKVGPHLSGVKSKSKANAPAARWRWGEDEVQIVDSTAELNRPRLCIRVFLEDLGKSTLTPPKTRAADEDIAENESPSFDVFVLLFVFLQLLCYTNLVLNSGLLISIV